MIGLLLALYPAQWRRRYGEEFRVVLESRPLGPFDVADVLLGALDARSRAFRLAGSPEKSGGTLTMLRLGGMGAIVGGALWAIGFVGANGTDTNQALWFAVAAIGSLGILLALVGLSAFQARRSPRLAWAAFVIPAAGALVSVVGMFGMATQLGGTGTVLGVDAWAVWAAGLIGLVLGSILFALATLRAEVLSRAAAVALAVTAGAFVVLGMLGFGNSDSQRGGDLVIAATVIAFGGSWAWLGFSALRRGPIHAVVPA